MLFRLRVNTSFRPSTRRPHARKPARSQSYDFSPGRTIHLPTVDTRRYARRLLTRSRLNICTYVHTSCLAERVSMTQISNTSFLPQKHICADSTRSLLTSERTSVFSVTSAAAPVGYHICLYSYLPSASAAVSPMCHPSRASGLLSALSPVSRLALRTELRHLTCNASITQSYV